MTHSVTDIPGVGPVTERTELVSVEPPLVTFRSVNVFEADGAVIESLSTLRFRERGEIEASLAEAGYLLDEVRGAPDRPGRELVFLARKPQLA